MSEVERSIIEAAKVHLMTVRTQITRTERYMNEYTQKTSGENWRRMMSEIETLEAMPTTPLLLGDELKSAMERNRPDGWPTGTKSWSK